MLISHVRQATRVSAERTSVLLIDMQQGFVRMLSNAVQDHIIAGQGTY